MVVLSCEESLSRACLAQTFLPWRSCQHRLRKLAAFLGKFLYTSKVTNSGFFSRILFKLGTKNENVFCWDVIVVIVGVIYLYWYFIELFDPSAVSPRLTTISKTRCLWHHGYLLRSIPLHSVVQINRCSCLEPENLQKPWKPTSSFLVMDRNYLPVPGFFWQWTLSGLNTRTFFALSLHLAGHLLRWSSLNTQRIL